MLEFSRIETLAGVKRTLYNQYDSLVLPLQSWLEAQGVRWVTDCKVTDLDHQTTDGKFLVTGIHSLRQDKTAVIAVRDGDLVFLQNGSMTDASSLGSMTSAPRKLTKADSVGWTLWERLAQGRPQFGNPAVFNSCIAHRGSAGLFGKRDRSCHAVAVTAVFSASTSLPGAPGKISSR